MLGGCSSLNFMAYIRGNSHDFDNWANITGDPSWSYDNVLPYFKKSEKMLDKGILYSKARKFHGTKGPIGVTKPNRREINKYLSAFEEIGYDVELDLNDRTSLGYAELSVTLAKGKRQSTAYSFLSKYKSRTNLHVLKNAFVTKILFGKNNEAIGVEALLEDDSKIRLYAKKEVIISAGAINTPKLLMLSGIGPKDHLKSLKINVISDLPVGQELRDHVMLTLVQKMGREPQEKQDLNPEEFPFPMFLGYTALNRTQEYPDYQDIHIIINSENVLQFCSTFFSYIDEICQDLFENSKGRELLYTVLTLLYPDSTGKVLLRSSNPKDPPLIHTGYYSNNTDLVRHARSLEHYMRINGSTLFKLVDSEIVDPKYCQCTHLKGPEYYECYVRCMKLSGYHFCGSAPMGPVLDSRLLVRGVKRVRVADASIMPRTVGANTQAATIMIGERCADIIKEDHFSS